MSSSLSSSIVPKTPTMHAVPHGRTAWIAWRRTAAIGAAFDGLVRAFTVAGQFTDSGHGVLLPGVDDVVGAELLGHLQP